MDLIYQYYDTKLPDWAQISCDRFRDYAKIVEAEYQFHNYPSDNPYYEWLRFIEDSSYDKYNKILFCDMDVVPEVRENIFDVPIEDIGLVAEKMYDGMKYSPYFAEPRQIKLYQDKMTSLHLPLHGNVIFNSGVVVWNRNGRIKARNNFMDYKIWYKNPNSLLDLDQPFLNSQLYLLKVTELPLKWNCYRPRHKWTHSMPSDINFVHYTGLRKNAIVTNYQNVSL